MLDQAHSVGVRFGKVYQAAPPANKPTSLSQPIAWAIVLTFALAVVSVGAAPFVDRGHRVAMGMVAALALIAFFTLVGVVRSTRNEG